MAKLLMKKQFQSQKLPNKKPKLIEKVFDKMKYDIE